MELGIWAWDYATEFKALENATYGSSGKLFFSYRNRGGPGQLAGSDASLTPPATQAAANANADISIFAGNGSEELAAANDGHTLGLSIQPKGGTGAGRMGIRYKNIVNGTWDFALIKMANECKALPNFATSRHVIMFHLEANIQKGTPSSQPWNGDGGTDIASYATILGKTESATWTVVANQFTAAYEYVRALFDAHGATNLIWCVNITRTAYLGNFGSVAAWFPAESSFEWYSVDGYSPGGINSPTDICETARSFMVSNSPGKKLWVYATGADEVPGNTSYKTQWFADWLSYLKTNKTTMAGVTIQHQGDSLNATPRIWEVDSQPGSVTANGDGRASPHFTGATFASFKTLANDPIFAQQTGTGYVFKTRDDWETQFNRGLEVHKTSVRPGSINGAFDVFTSGGPESQDIADTTPTGSPYGPRHVVPLRDLRLAGFGATGAYTGFSLGWKNMADDVTPVACTSPDGQNWPAWSETPTAWVRRNLVANIRTLPGPVIIAFHANPLADLIANKRSWVAQGGLAADVTIQTFVDAYAKLMFTIRTQDNLQPIKNLVGVALWLDPVIYSDTDPANTFALWSNIGNAGYIDFLGVSILNDYSASGTWRPFASDFQYVLKHAHELGKPVIVEAGSQPDPANSNRRATWFDAMRKDIEGQTIFANGEQAALGDVEVLILDLNAGAAADTYAVDTTDPSANTSDTATNTMVLDVINDPALTPQAGTGAKSFLKQESGRLGIERSSVAKSVSSLLYDSATLYDSAALYDGVTSSTTVVFASDYGVGADTSTPTFVSKTASDSGSADDSPTSVARSGSSNLTASDFGDAFDTFSNLIKAGAQSLTATDNTGSATDLARPVQKVNQPPSSAYDTLYVADPTDPAYPWNPAKVYIDLNANAAGTGFGWSFEAELNLGRRTVEDTFIVQAPWPGGDLAQAEQTIVEATIPLLGVFPDTATMLTEYRKLAEVLDSDSAVFVWKPRGATESLFIDVVHSDIPSLLEGQERATHRVFGLKLVIDLPVVIRCQPRLRKAPVTVATGALSMRATKRHLRVSNPGNTTSIARVRISPRSGSHLVQARVGGFQGGLTEYETMLSLGDIQFADEQADNSSATFRDVPSNWYNQTLHTVMDNVVKKNFQRRWSQTFVAGPSVNALQGRYRVRMVVSMNHRMKFQMRYGLAQATKTGTLVTDVEVVRDSFRIDPGAATGGNSLVELDFGIISVPEGTRFLQVEGWCGTDDDLPQNGTFSVVWYEMVLMPLDLPEVTISVPGFRQGGNEAETWTWSERELSRDGPFPGYLAVKTTDDAIILNKDGEVAFVKPRDGLPLPVGRHRFTFSGHIEDGDHDKDALDYPPGRQMFVVEVLDVTSGTVNIMAPSAAAVGGRQRMPGTKSGRLTTQFEAIIEFDSVLGKLYLPQFRFIRPQTPGRRVFANRIQHSVMRTVDFGAQMVLDGWSRSSSMRSSSDQRLLGLSNTGFIDIEPGDQDLVFSFSEVPSMSGGNSDDYYDMDPREPVGEVNHTRVYDVEVDLISCVVAM